ncbi:O-methyltransferase-domain-containing protein, partial [Exophiala viscosa]
PFTGKEAISARAGLLANTHKLQHLSQGPTAPWMGTLNGAFGDAMTSAAIYHFKIADRVPIGKEASFEQVAVKAGLALRDFKMIVRYAMTNFIFCEPRPGFIAHTASSRLLAENKLIRSLMSMGVNEIFPGTVKEIETLQRYPGSEEPNESAWAIANDARSPLFTELANRHPNRAENMAFAMESLATMMPDVIILEAYDWASMGTATIVDVGGGKGLVCRQLAKHFPRLSFVVQDLQVTADAGREQLPTELQDRITFGTHDFFTPQPVKGADVYFFRAIFHDWPDKYCIQILHSLIPALKNGAKIIIQDPFTSDPLSMHPWQDRECRASNLRMKLFFNACDRETTEWRELIGKADSRFRLKGIEAHAREPQNEWGPKMALLEIIWDG